MSDEKFVQNKNFKFSSWNMIILNAIGTKVNPKYICQMQVIQEIE